MTDDPLATQLAYYRRRAAEYDATAYGDLAAARRRIARLVGDMQPTGRVIELACGTGLWTQALAEHADTVLATDAAPEVLQIARERVRSANVRFEVADAFAMTGVGRFDVIFFSAWLSHVPTGRFEDFWQLLRGLLTDGGRVLFIDEHVDVQEKENFVADESETVERRLGDGTAYRIVKNFVDPEQLQRRLRGIGWDCTTRRDGTDWVSGEARPLP